MNAATKEGAPTGAPSYAQSIYRTAGRNGWQVEREGDELVVRDQEGRWVRHRLSGQAEFAYMDRMVPPEGGGEAEREEARHGLR